MRVGLSSWADPALIEERTFYPKKSMSAEARLRFYASVFDVVEVNASYYAIPDVLTVQRWAERTPPGFVFHAKAWSLMTGHHPRAQTVPPTSRPSCPRHPRRRGAARSWPTRFPPRVSTRPFACSAPRWARWRLPASSADVLFQFAPRVHFEERWLEYLAGLPARLPGWTLAVELRHRSWFPDHADETLRALRQAGLAHVVTDAPAVAGAMPHVTAVTAPIAVMRLHGRNAEGWLRQLRGEEPAVREKYDYLYQEPELAALVPELAAMAEESEEVFVSFNNNNRDYPVRNALMLKRLLGQPTREVSFPADLFG